MLFILAAAALVANTIATQPDRAAVGIAVVLLGLPVYFLWRGAGTLHKSEVCNLNKSESESESEI